MKDAGYVINHDEYELLRTHWIALYMNGYSETYFDLHMFQKKFKSP